MFSGTCNINKVLLFSQVLCNYDSTIQFSAIPVSLKTKIVFKVR